MNEVAVRGTLRGSDHVILKFFIRKEAKAECSCTCTLDFRKANFNKLITMIRKIARREMLTRKGIQEVWKFLLKGNCKRLKYKQFQQGPLHEVLRRWGWRRQMPALLHQIGQERSFEEGFPASLHPSFFFTAGLPAHPLW